MVLRRLWIDKCPNCGSTNLEAQDQLDYGAYAMICFDCGWQGISDELVTESLDKEEY